MNAHCETGSSGTFRTAELSGSTAVEGVSTGEEPALRATLGGLSVTIKCSTSHLVGASITNVEPAAWKHKIVSTGSLTYTGCHAVLASKETQTCAVEEVTGPKSGTIGMVSTNTLEGETTGVEHKVKFKPNAAAAGVFAKFNILKKGSVPTEENECPFASEVKVEVKGSVEGESNTTNHSHLTFTEANNGSLLLANGSTAKYVGTIGGSMAGQPEVTVGAETFTVTPAPLTAVTCENKGAGARYSSAKCETPEAPGNFETTALPLNTTKAVEGGSTGAEPTLRAVLAGTSFTVMCSASQLVGAWVKDVEPAAGAHKVESGGSLTYTGCHAALKANETRTCAIEEVTGGGGAIGMISTSQLKAETGVEHRVKVESAAGEGLTEFRIKPKGSVPAEEHECFFNVAFSINIAGTIQGEVNTTNHSHLTFTEANNGSFVKASGLPVTYIDTIGGSIAGQPGVPVGAQTFT